MRITAPEIYLTAIPNSPSTLTSRQNNFSKTPTLSQTPPTHRPQIQGPSRAKANTAWRPCANGRCHRSSAQAGALRALAQVGLPAVPSPRAKRPMNRAASLTQARARSAAFSRNAQRFFCPAEIYWELFLVLFRDGWDGTVRHAATGGGGEGESAGLGSGRLVREGGCWDGRVCCLRCD